MSSEDNFDDKPLTDVDAQAVAKALDNDPVFERSSAPAKVVLPLPSSTDEFPDEPEPMSEPMPEPEPLDAEFVDPANAEDAPPSVKLSEHHSSYGHSDPASLAAAGSGELHDPELTAQVAQDLPHAALSSLDADAQEPHSVSVAMHAAASAVLPEGLVLQPHLAHLAKVGLVDSDTWDEQVKPRIEHLQTQISEVNERLDHLTTTKHR